MANNSKKSIYLKRFYISAIFLLFSVGLFLCVAVIAAIKPLPVSLPLAEKKKYADILDRNGYYLSVTKQNRLNPHSLPLWKIPELIKQAFIIAEDKRFYEHKGVDWLARLNAMIINIKEMRIVRGASTITEQCIRIIHPRPRTFFSRIVETVEAYQLENRFSKEEILEFYLNQVPFSHRCRGVFKAADYYFGRTLDTLNRGESLSLAVMIRAPSRLNPLQESKGSELLLKTRIADLAVKMQKEGLLNEVEINTNSIKPFKYKALKVEASHFIQYVKKKYINEFHSNARLVTSIDGHLQNYLTSLLKESLLHLAEKNVRHGAILVLDHQTDEILAWVNGSDFFSSEPSSQIDAVLAKRQPGSTLKPFLYALALERGFTAATVIPDIPVRHPVGNGLHSFKNYSNRFYGPVRLRSALGNSLNVPAIQVIKNLGVIQFLDLLNKLGFKSLNRNALFYGEGLALGNGEVTLFELVQAYSVLARSGLYRNPKFFFPDSIPSQERRIFSIEVCDLISNILSDPTARSLEFGTAGLLDFPVQTVIKTGTSSDYRDAWAVGYNYKYTVGAWMGNLDYSPMDDITGSRGPALLLRSLFHELNRNQETKPLSLHHGLQEKQICALSGELATNACPSTITEWFRPTHLPSKSCSWHRKQGTKIITSFPYEYHEYLESTPNMSPDSFNISSSNKELATNILAGKNLNGVYIKQPVSNLHLALDPRIPDELERFPLTVESKHPIKRIEWFINKERIAATGSEVNKYMWNLKRGNHTVFAKVSLVDDDQIIQTPSINFLVK